MLHKFQAEGTDAGLNFDIALEPGKKVYCFIGENGVGKTNLAENLARSLLYVHSLLSEDGNGKFSQLFLQKKINERLKSLFLQLAGTLQLDGVSVKDRKGDSWSSSPLEYVFQRGSKGYQFDTPLVFIGARDRGYIRNIQSDRLQILGDRQDRFIDAFSRTFKACSDIEHTIDTLSTADWFNSRLIINPAFVVGEDDRSHEVVAVLNLIKELEPSMAALVVPNKDGSSNLVDIQFREGKLWFSGTPIDKLATGYVALVRIFQEIVGGYGGWTGALPDKTPPGEVEGVVFIDEIESHLHPKWQAQLLPLLRRSFPKTTFFICTHSPLVVSSTEEGEAYELERKGRNVTARKIGNPRDWYLADVYSQAFHVSLPLTGSSPVDSGSPLVDTMEQFSIEVKDYLRTKDEKHKQEALRLYDKIIPSLPPSDPRRKSLDSLKALLP